MIGAVIGSYRIVQQIGKGGMGVVYLGQHTLLGRSAAIKVLLPELSAQPETVNRFFNEARAVTSIRDPGIVQVFDFGHHTDGSAFIVMELLEGEPMDRRLERIGRFALADGLRLARLICTSLAAAHAAGIVHRDLKPENVYLVPDPAVPGGERAKLLDFGIAKLSDAPGLHRTQAGALLGTPLYMSPEQCRGTGEVDHRSDIYTMGCVLYAMLTGAPPFDSRGIGELILGHLREPPPLASSRVRELPDIVDQILLRCLEKAPEARFSSMIELAQALARAEHSAPDVRTTGPDLDAAIALPRVAPTLPIVQPPPGVSRSNPTTLGAATGQSVTRPRSRTRRWLAPALIGATTLAGTLGFLALRSEEPSPPPPIATSSAVTSAPRPAAIDAASAPGIDHTAGVPGAVMDASDAGVPDAPDGPPVDAAPSPRPPPPRHGSKRIRTTPRGNHESSTIPRPEIDRGD
ncbi:MAG TPA: serine/threonine-protein kinase [Kofleriaceae bacterium]|nr:serine/threonine-protein kinase [Kofleriaceae bacterium]